MSGSSTNLSQTTTRTTSLNHIVDTMDAYTVFLTAGSEGPRNYEDDPSRGGPSSCVIAQAEVPVNDESDPGRGGPSSCVIA